MEYGATRHVTARGGGRGDRWQSSQTGRRVAINKALVTDSQCRQRGAVNLGLVVRGDGQGCWRDGESRPLVLNCIIIIDGPTYAYRVRVPRDRATGRRRGRDRGGRVGSNEQVGRDVAVDQACILHSAHLPLIISDFPAAVNPEPDGRRTVRR